MAWFVTPSTIHAALARLGPGDPLTMNRDDRGNGLFDRGARCVARLSRNAEHQWQHRLRAIRELRVLAMIHRSIAQETEPDRAARCRVQKWELPMVEVVSEEGFSPEEVAGAERATR